MTRPCADMTVAITGASAGIGAALALALATAGARLALCARRTDKLAEILALVTAATPGPDAGRRHWSCRADVAEPADCAAFIAGAERHFDAPIDTLVCNAGYGLARTVADTTPADWDRILRTNLLGTTECIRAALPAMRRAPIRAGWRGQVMIVSSGLARRGKPDGGAYSATKAAQLSVAEALRVELADERIAVTSVHPITTTTEFIAAATVGALPRPTGTIRRAGGICDAARDPATPGRSVAAWRIALGPVVRHAVAGIRRPLSAQTAPQRRSASGTLVITCALGCPPAAHRWTTLHAPSTPGS